MFSRVLKGSAGKGLRPVEPQDRLCLGVQPLEIFIREMILSHPGIGQIVSLFGRLIVLQARVRSARTNQSAASCGDDFCVRSRILTAF